MKKLDKKKLWNDSIAHASRCYRIMNQKASQKEIFAMARKLKKIIEKVW